MTGDTELSSLSLSDLKAELEERARERPDQRNRARASPLAAATTANLVKSLRDRQKLIYGMDDRKDFYEFPDNLVLELSRSVAAMFRAVAITDVGDGTSTLRTVKFASAHNLCEGEPFREQPVGANCTGFLVAPDVIATAGHCLNASNVTTMRFVFGFRMAAPGEAVTRIPNVDIYAGVNLLGHVLDHSGPDWALVKLDRIVSDRPVLPVRRSGRIADDAPVAVMGHPSGLPVKYAAGAVVRDNTPSAFFVANLDTYGGNSGSPVFGVDNVVEGILVRGETDFVDKGGCMVSNICPTTGCRGEDCTRVSEFVSLLQ